MEEASIIALRLAVFVGVLSIMALLEFVIPKRPLGFSKIQRWTTNGFFIIAGAIVIRIMAALPVPLAAVAAAYYAETQGWGLLNMVEWPFWVELVLSLALLDMAIYFQHWASHKIPVLWMFHKVHHSDVDIDVTTAIRFHPIEIGLSMLYKIILIFILGPAAAAVMLFEMILNGCAMFNHANIALPKWLDSFVRIFLVTPDMHRIHHSKIRTETDSNYGFSISLWDRLFRTYIAQPKMGHDLMDIGLPEHQNANPTKILWTLKFPFSKEKG